VALLESRLEILQKSLVELISRVSKDHPVKQFVPEDGNFSINNLVKLMSLELAEGNGLLHTSSVMSCSSSDEDDESDEDEKVSESDEIDQISYIPNHISNNDLKEFNKSSELPVASDGNTPQMSRPISSSAISATPIQISDNSVKLQVSHNSESELDLNGATFSERFFLDTEYPNPSPNMFEFIADIPVEDVCPEILEDFDDSDVVEDASLDMSINGRPLGSQTLPEGISNRRLSHANRNLGRLGDGRFRVHKSSVTTQVVYSMSPNLLSRRASSMSILDTMVGANPQCNGGNSQFDNLQHCQNLYPDLFQVSVDWYQ
jgi:hypothetical protein